LFRIFNRSGQVEAMPIQHAGTMRKNASGVPALFLFAIALSGHR